MSPKDAVNRLCNSGLTQGEIASLLFEMDVVTTQETISRIGTGKIQNPSFSLGQALIGLCEQKQGAEQEASAA